MDHNIILKCVVLFNFLFPLLWIVFYTFHPTDIMDDEDFIGPGNQTRGGHGVKNNRDSNFSMPGRSLIFLVSLLISFVIVIFSYIYLRFYAYKPVIKCPKGSKNLKQCSLVNN